MVEIGLLVIAMSAVVLSLYSFRRNHVRDVTTPKESESIKRLWAKVDAAMASKRYQTAEKALLLLLRVDRKNTAAYNRLGMLYVKQEQYDDAISCFDIASSLAPSVSSLYNLGLVHYQKGNYNLAAAALERVIDLEPTPKRLLVFAKVLASLGNNKRVIETVERAVEMDPSNRNLEYLASSYESAKQYEKAEIIRQQISNQ